MICTSCYTYLTDVQNQTLIKDGDLLFITVLVSVIAIKERSDSEYRVFLRYRKANKYDIWTTAGHFTLNRVGYGVRVLPFNPEVSGYLSLK